MQFCMGCGFVVLLIAGLFFWPLWILAAACLIGAVIGGGEKR